MKTMYFDAMRGLVAVKPIGLTEGDHGRVTYQCRVTARGDNARPYRTGQIIDVPATWLVYKLHRQMCVMVPGRDAKAAIAASNRN